LTAIEKKQKENKRSTKQPVKAANNILLGNRGLSPTSDQIKTTSTSNRVKTAP